MTTKTAPRPAGLACLLLLTVTPVARSQTASDVPKAPPGWKVEVLTRAPKIQHPSVVVAAPDGRIFVAEDPVDMHLPSSAEADRILCFHPDGRVTTFAEKLHAVFGMLYLDGKLYVHHTPKLSVFTDDGSGVANDRTDLFDCTNPNPWATGGFNDHIPAQIRLAMDGFIYMSVGDKGIYGMVGKDGKKAELRGGGIVRFRPDGTDLEVFSTGTRNHLDFSINAEDDLFTWDNTDDGRGWWTRFTHMVDGGFYGYPWDYWPDDPTPQKVEEQIRSGKPGQPYTLWRMAEYGSGSPCGAVAYNDDALPPEYHGNLFHCEWGKGNVSRFVVERAGGTYKVVKREDFLTPGGELRPLGINPTPDGMGFLVTDWNYGGWKQPTEGGKRGRLIRVTWTGQTRAAPRPRWYIAAATGKPFTASHEELIEALKHPAQSVRLVGQRRIADRGQEAVAPLVALVLDSGAPPHARWHAIWALDRIDNGRAGWTGVLKVVSDPKADLSVRRQAVRQLGTRRPKDAAEARHTMDALLEAMDHGHLSLRFHAATAMGRVADARAVQALQSRASGNDLFTQYAIVTALNRIGRSDPSAWREIVKGGPYLALRETYEPELVRALSEYVRDDFLNPLGRPAALEALAQLHRKPKPWDGRWWGTQPVLSPRPRKEVEWEGTQTVVQALRDALKDPAPGNRLAAVKGLQIAPDPQVGDQLAVMFERVTDAKTRREVLRAITACKPEAAAQFVGKILLDPKSDPALVEGAIAVAERARGAAMADLLAKAAGSDAAKPGIVVAALEALTRMRERSVVPVASKLVTDKTRPVEVRRAAAEALAASRSADAVEPLLKAWQEEPVRRDATLALAALPDVRALDAYLAGLDTADATLRQRCREAIKGISGQALPLVEAKLDTQKFSPQAIADLQSVFLSHQPVREWRVLGPIPSEDGDPFPLTNPNLQPRGEVKRADGKELRWRTVRARGPEGVVDLGSDSRSEAYAYAEVQSDVARPVELRVGSDDRMTLYLNGMKVHDDRGESGWSAEEATVRATLRAGRNVLLARVGNAGGGWMFSVAVSGEQKGKLFRYVVKSLDPAAYAQYADRNAGDPARGRAIFNNAAGAACAKCHQVNGQGGEAGPALTGVGAKYNRSQLIESVLYPSKQIFDGYQQTLVRTKSGDTWAGAVRGETQDELTLIDAENKKHVIKKSDVERRKLSELSLMPDGLHAGLKPQEFADLIAYLQGLKEPAAK